MKEANNLRNGICMDYKVYTHAILVNPACFGPSDISPGGVYHYANLQFYMSAGH